MKLFWSTMVPHMRVSLFCISYPDKFEDFKDYFLSLLIASYKALLVVQKIALLSGTVVELFTQVLWYFFLSCTLA